MLRDGDRLRQVVANLLSNAMKFTPNGGLVTVTLARDGDRLHAIIQDTGKGSRGDTRRRCSFHPGSPGFIVREIRAVNPATVIAHAIERSRADDRAEALAHHLLKLGPRAAPDTREIEIQPGNVGLAQALIHTYRGARPPERAKLLARADEAATLANAVAPDSEQAQSVKAEILGLHHRFDAALATYDRAIALDRNLTSAHGGRARNLIAAGRAADAVAPVEKPSVSARAIPNLFLWC